MKIRPYYPYVARPGTMPQIRWAIDFDGYPFKLPKKGRYVVYVRDRTKKGQYWIIYPGMGTAYNANQANYVTRKMFDMTRNENDQYVERVADHYPVASIIGGMR